MAPSSPSTGRRNRLAAETSPYLLQHQTNPVDWWPWGPEALAEAARTGKPILLSVGYAACHWCHVMAHESFEDEPTAAVMNDLFVNIKVDREERPDIDQIYMAALHHLGEHGGWPLTMFLTPAGEPIWGGTYFPPTARYGKPGFADVLREVARLFREEPARIEGNRRALLQRLAGEKPSAPSARLSRQDLDMAAQRILGAFDPENGGLKGAPKFPQSALFELLWRAGLRNDDEASLDAIEHTLEHICEGGIYDHLGGGFSRYAVDDRWLVPHFEKMLYDNAHLLDLLSLAFLRSANPLFAARARETVAWLAREMTTPEGAFCASLDADSEGEEGKFYVWSPSEIERTLGVDAATFNAAYGVTPHGNFEGHTILNRLHALPRTAWDGATEHNLAQLRSKLLAVRDSRVRPGLDDKVLADWNGLMIAALVHAGVVFDEPSWITRARTAFDFVATQIARDDRLGHSWRAGRFTFPGLASDLAIMIRAALSLYDVQGDDALLAQALRWQSELDSRYAGDPGYYLTADDAEGLVIRPAATADDAIANHNAYAAENLVRLAVLTGEDRWREAADQLFSRLAPAIAANAFAHAALLNALDLRLHGAEVIVVGEGPNADALHRAALRLPHLQRTVRRISATTPLAETHPVAAQRAAAPADGAAFICAGARCSLPVTHASRIAETLVAMRG